MRKTGKIRSPGNSMTKNVLITHFIFIILIILLLGGCSAVEGLQSTPTPTAIPTPAATPTPLPDKAILIIPDGTEAALANEASQMLSQLAVSSNLVFESRTSIDQKEITPEVKIIVFLNHPNNLGTMANASPGTQFAVLSDLDWKPGSNVTLIRRRAEAISFLAGFMSVNLDNNFRGGALISSEDGISQQAFANGGHYFCGLCSPSIPPYVKYPLIAIQPSGSNAAAWQAAFDPMYQNGVRVVYVAAEAYSPELFNYLVSKEVILYGPQTPPDIARSRWAATLLVDGLSPIKEIWPDLIAGKGGKIVYGGVRFTDVQPAFISPGCLDYFQKITARIQAGMLNPLNVSD